ncbi:MAG: hypothetical protein C4516_07240 [Oxalobacter sp.]|nr:MAG: hypothetical protein C4516_07240 [Oxalobacter sp.]
MTNPFTLFAQHYGVISTLESELRAGLERFWRTAGTILNGSAIQLVPTDQASFSLPRNFFSTLFLYSYYRTGIPSERRILYAAVNQCLRGMVTGCDNLLDDEYKVTLETDLPPQAHRFRSVLDIMVADRVLFAILQDYCRAHDFSVDLALQASTASLQALTRSGVQEASEEGGIGAQEERLAPDVILSKIHHLKTGILFQSTWAIPALFEKEITNKAQAEVQSVQEALHQIGIGCQIFDDIVDLFIDVHEQRHNYVASVIVHQESASLCEQMRNGVSCEQTIDRFYASCPELFVRMKTLAMTTLESGLRQLFLDEHQSFVRPAASFIANRIGVKMD